MTYIEPWGYHMTMDCAGCDPMAIADHKLIGRFALDLVSAIDMVPFGKPYVVRFGEGNKAGYSLVQLIHTSTITGHFCEETSDAFIDVFSCKYFDPETAADVVNRFFAPAHINKQLMYRIASIPPRIN